LVFDTGARWSERFDSGKAVIAPFLRQHAVKKVDALVISHSDRDHIGGVESVMASLPVAKIYASAIDDKRITQAQLCRSGMAWQWDGVSFVFLHPSDDYQSASKNNNSCVLMIKTTAHRILLTGDIEKGAEKHLVTQLAEGVAANILVAPHHGSRTSSSDIFVNAVAPQWVLFPVGYRNRYGFPKRTVVQRYHLHHVHDYNTAEHGAIGFKFRGEVIEGPILHRQQQKRYWHTTGRLDGLQ